MRHELLEKCRRGLLVQLADVLDCKSIADGSTPGRDRVRDFSVLTNQHFFRFVSACLPLVCMTVCTGVGKWLHTLLSHPKLGELQGFSSQTTTYVAFLWSQLTLSEQAGDYIAVVVAKHS